MKSNSNSTTVTININNQVEKGMKKTVKAVIDGTVKNIIIGRSPYNMERPKDKSDLLSAIDRKSQLRVIFHLCVPQPFLERGYNPCGFGRRDNTSQYSQRICPVRHCRYILSV